MATTHKIKIGTASIAADEADSTVIGTRAAFGDISTGLVITESPSDIRIPFRIHIVGDDNEEVLDRVSDTLDLLDAMNTDGVSVEIEPGVDVVEVQRSDVRSIRYEFERRPGDGGTVLEGTIVVEKFDPDIQDGMGVWQYQRNGSGRGFVTGRIRATSRAAAVAAAAPLRSGAARPVWLSTAFKVQEDTNEFDFQGGTIGLASDTAYAPAEILVVYEQLPAWAASDPAFADVVRLELSFQATNRPPLDNRAGHNPGLDVSLTGTLTFKTESGTTYDASDTSVVASTAMHSKVLACISAIIAEAERRLGEGVLTPMGDIERFITGADGVYQFALPMITGGANRVLEWDEDELYERNTQDVILDIYDGSHWVFEHPAGWLETITHRLSIAALGGARGYVQPQQFGRGRGKWKTMREGDKPPKIMRHGPGIGSLPASFRFITHYERDYRLIRSGSGRVFTQG